MLKIKDKEDLAYWIRRIKEERAELRAMLTSYEEMKDASKFDKRLSGYSYAINCQKGMIDTIQGLINDYNREVVYGKD